MELGRVGGGGDMMETLEILKELKGKQKDLVYLLMPVLSAPRRQRQKDGSGS